MPIFMGLMNLALGYEIACLILTALFFFAFSVAREPRGWRRLFQSMFSKSGEFSVNKNKVIDETLKKYGILVAMMILLADVSIFVWGLTEDQRKRDADLNNEDRVRINEYNSLKSSSGGDARRPVSM
jgi:hypothetical protein